MSDTPPIVSVTGGVGGIVASLEDLADGAVRLRSEAAWLESSVHRMSALGWAAAHANSADATGEVLGRQLQATAHRAEHTVVAQALLLAELLRRAAGAYARAEVDVAGRFSSATGTAVRSLRDLVPVIAVLPVHPVTPALRPDLVQGLVSMWPGYRETAARLAADYPDGHAHTVEIGPDGSAAAPPRSLADIVQRLGRRSNGAGGDIDVQILLGADGARRVIVDIPGTTDWSGAHINETVTDLGTNLHAMAGEHTTYADGVIAALHQAGVGAADEIMLVGHSQGGMIATELANRLSSGTQFTVTDVVTLGAPIGLATVPASVRLLAVESSTDVVPSLDGRANRESRNHVTVTVKGSGGLSASHSIGSAYVPAAAALDRSDDPSVRAALAALSPYLTAASSTTTVYHVSRQQ